MDNNEKLRDRIKRSLENASSTIELKMKIEQDISNIMELVHELTNGEIGFDVVDNIPVNPKFEGCNKLIFLKKSTVNFPYGFHFIGYSLHKQSGYPVSVETETQYFDCDNEGELTDVIASIIEEKSLKIIELMSTEVNDIPF